MDMTIFPAFNRAIILYLIIILAIAIYYVSSRIDLSSFTGTENTAIPIGVLFLLITNGFFMGNHGFTGDFGLDYCNDGDKYSEAGGIQGYIRETESVKIHPESFFACELGYIDGFVDLGWRISISSYQQDFISDQWNIMILNHDNYKNYVAGEDYGVSNFYLSELQVSANSDDRETTKYKVGLTLHSDTYFFVIDREYWETRERFTAGSNRGLIGPNSPTGTSENVVGIKYEVDLDYDTSGVTTTN